MISLGWTSKHILQQAISTVSAYNPSKPRFICLGMAKEVSSGDFCATRVIELTAVDRLLPALSTAENEDSDNLSGWCKHVLMCALRMSRWGVSDFPPSGFGVSYL